jgi:hypothetical protein
MVTPSITADDAKSHTAQKFDWLTCLAVDVRVKPRAFEVGFVIIQHVNMHSKRAWLSDEAISDASGSCKRDVQRCRDQLRKFGWLTWKRTRTANIYTPLFDQVNVFRELIELQRNERSDRRAKRHLSRSE